MAETDTLDGGRNVIKVSEEVEGDQIGTRNYRFSKIGEPVSITSDSDFKFDMDNLPSCPLAVSERSGVIFVAHSSGFFVARIKDVMDISEELKNGGNVSSIQERSVVDVSLGKVSILALSADSTMLAASVGFNLYFFTLDGLLNKDTQPSFSKILDGSSSIKDMQWSPHLKNQYVVLTSDRSLYGGADQDNLCSLMENVDAVSWSMNGRFLAVAKKDYLSILSTKYEEKLRIQLLFDSLVDDSDADSVLQVDSIKWVRSDCIILGIYRLSADGKEENYVVQFILVKDGTITKPSSNPVALTFSDAFLAISHDDIPFGSGPYMFVSYLDERGLAFVANRKNTNQHIVLFGWSDKKDGAEMIDISNDAWLPTINLQDNSDDNLILGIAVDKIYKDEKVRLVLGEEDTEVPPCCIFLCLTVDGKLFMFHFASATGPTVLLRDVDSVSDEEEESPLLSSQHLVTDIVNDEKQVGEQVLHELQPEKVKVDEPSEKAGYQAHMRSGDEQTKSTKISQPFKDGVQQDISVVRPNNNRDEQSLCSQTQEGNFKKDLYKSPEHVITGALDKDLKRFENQEVAGVKSSDLAHMRSGDEQMKSTQISQLFKGAAQQAIPVVRSNNSRDDQSLHSQKQEGSFKTDLFKLSGHVIPGGLDKDLNRFENKEVAGVKSSDDSVSKSVNDKSNKMLFGASLEGFRASTELSVSEPSIGLPGSSGSFISGSVFSSNLFEAQSSSPPAVVQGSAESSGKIGSINLPVSSGPPSSGGMFSSRTLDVKSTLAPPAIQGNRTSIGATHFSSGTQKTLFSKAASGPSYTNQLLGQGVSTGAGFTNSQSVASNAHQSLGKSSDFKFADKGNVRNQAPSRLLTSQPISSEQRSVEEMARELDALLDSIEGPGGFYDASVTAHEPSVAALEDGIWALSDRCQKRTDTMDLEIGEVQLLLDKTVQVLARKIYMEAIVKQATDSQYLDIWNRQKLSSELDMKRRHILEIHQNLTNQLIELERHLNTLELQRFGDKGDVQMNRRSSHAKHGPPRHIQSLHSLHNTMNAQLAAAEKLSECLSKQMAVLSIETEPVKYQNVKKELFDTIGISYDGASIHSPGQGKARETPPKSKALVSSLSVAANTDSKKSQLGAVKSSEPETARRRRDSLDRDWASIEPPKTTVKRMQLQEGYQKSPGRLSSASTGVQKPNRRLSEISDDIPRGVLNTSQPIGSQVAQIKQEGFSNSSLWDKYNSHSSKTPITSALSIGPGSQSTPTVRGDAKRDSRDLAAQESRSRLTFTLKSNPVVVNDQKFGQQTQSSHEPSLNTTRPPTMNIFEKKSSEFSESSRKDAAKSGFTVRDGNQKSIVNESSSIWSRKTPESPFSAVLSGSSSTAFSGKSFSLDASKRESQPGEIVSSSIASSPAPVTSVAPPSFVFKDTSSSSTSATSLGSVINLSATQTVPISGSSASFSSFSSTTSFGAPKEPMTPFSIKPSGSIELNTSKSELSKSNLDSTRVVSEPKPDEKFSAQSSPPEPLVSLTPPIQLKPTSEPSTSLFTTSSPTLASSFTPVSPALSPPAISDTVNENLDTQEDEMEEEAPDTSQLTLGSLGGFGLGTAPNPAAPKPNPFGASFGNPTASMPITSFTAAPPAGGLFKPASFTMESSQPSQQTSFGAFSGFSNPSSAQGFGQPARIGAGQQALGSVLGSFGQSRQFGAGLPGSVASPSPFQPAGGFATASTGGGFANLASGVGGFGSLATAAGGFASVASSTGGFGALAGTGGGFAGATSGGFGGFSSQGASGFSAFGSTGGTTRPPSELFTQMRK